MPNDDLREFLIVVRKAMLEVVYWIEEKYKLAPPDRYRQYFQTKYSIRNAAN